MNKLALLIILLGVAIGIFVYIGKQPPALPLSCSLFGSGCPSFQIRGHVAKGFEPVRARFEQNFKDGLEIGSSFYAYHNGELVVQLTGGFWDNTFQKEYTEEALNIVFSSTKVLTALCVAMLVDRGQLAYEDPIAKYWPEFAANGKENITVGELTSHAAALSSFNETLFFTEWFPMTEEKFQKLGRFLEGQSVDPEWKKIADSLPKGTRLQGYHALTGGFYLSQLISRADPKHRSMSKFLRDEITTQLGIDLYVADLQEGNYKRISPIHTSPMWKVFAYDLPKALLPKPIFELLYREKHIGMSVAEMMKNPIFLGSIGAYRFERTETNFDLTSHNHPLAPKVESPASSGYANAAALAKVAAVMANRGEFNGVRLLKEETFEKANHLFDIQKDLVMPVELQYTLGGWGKISPKLKTVGWGGAGGSFIQWDPTINFGAGYVMNFYESELLGHRGFELIRIAHECAEKLTKISQ